MARSKTQETWNENVSKAQDAIQELIDIQFDCQAKYDEMTEKDKEGEKGVALGSVCDLDLQSVMDMLSDASQCEVS